MPARKFVWKKRDELVHFQDSMFDLHQSIMESYFEIRLPAFPQPEVSSDLPAHIRWQCALGHPVVRKLSPEQEYLQSLLVLSGAFRKLTSAVWAVRSARMPLTKFGAAAALERPVDELSHSTYEFEAKVKMHWKVCKEIIPRSDIASPFSIRIGKLVKTYQRVNSRLMSRRGQLVHAHSPSGHDEFHAISFIEMLARMKYPKIQEFLPAAFAEHKGEWKAVAESAFFSTKDAVDEIVTLNKDLLKSDSFSFQSPRPKT